jgi:hypothetical protein
VVLLNRYAERAALGRLLDAARAGQSPVLVVRGVPGIGKTALLEDAIESATGFRVARIVGVESQMELAFAALQQLCGPMLDRADRLPAPQRDALGVTFGLRAGLVPDRFLVGLAALSLLAEAAAEQAARLYRQRNVPSSSGRSDAIRCCARLASRTRLRARLRRLVISQAPGRSGMPLARAQIDIEAGAPLTQLPVAANQPAFGAPNTNTMGAMHG